MFKSTSENLNHINRVASASTREHATGRIDMIPAWAREPEEYYNSVKQQWEVLSSRMREIADQLAEINYKLKRQLPRNEFDFLRSEKIRLGTIYTDLQPEAVKIREIVRAAAMDSWANVFYHCASLMLSREVFSSIDKATQEMLGRSTTGINKGRSEFSEQKLAGTRRRENLQEKRQRFRDSVKSGDNRRLIWSDEKKIRPGHIPDR